MSDEWIFPPSIAAGLLDAAQTTRSDLAPSPSVPEEMLPGLPVDDGATSPSVPGPTLPVALLSPTAATAALAGTSPPGPTVTDLTAPKHDRLSAPAGGPPPPVDLSTIEEELAELVAGSSRSSAGAPPGSGERASRAAPPVLTDDWLIPGGPELDIELRGVDGDEPRGGPH